MRFASIILTAAFIWLSGLPVQAAPPAHTHARLVLSAEMARAGDTIIAGVHLQMDPGWHTYWRNPGNSGLGISTAIDWQLPAGVTAGKIQWPVPKKLIDTNNIGSAEDSTTYIYEDDVVLLIPLNLAPSLPSGILDLTAKISWLECAVQCLPGKTNLTAKLEVGTHQTASADAKLLASWQNKLPRAGDGLSARAWWERSATGELRPLVVQWISATPVTQADFFPDASEQFEMRGPTERLPAEPGKIQLRKEVKKLAGDWPAEVSGLLVHNPGPQQVAYEIKLPVEPSASISSAAPGSSTALAASLPVASIWQMLLYAFLGGLILNVMPCVLPVIALKILGFVSQAKDDPREIRKLGVIYGFGVVVSFLFMAGGVIGLKLAGQKAGWGMQFSSPLFVVALTILVTLVALNLFGVFEVNLPGQVMNSAGRLASKHGPGGAFFNGVLATVLATPCTAPFLSPALGFAFAQKAPVILLIFVTAGTGLAAPYVLLSWHPAWLKFLPRPGPWMEKFKVAMGFPMLATALWLFSLLPIHYGERSWWFAIFLLLLALSAWIFGEFVQRGRARRSVALAASVLVLLAAYVGVLEHKLQWRVADAGRKQGDAPSHAPKGLSWQPWSREAVDAGRSEGHPVLIDFTANWCLTCNTIVKPALENSRVRERLLKLNAVPLLGDYSRPMPLITEELDRLAHPGVPLVVIYPTDPKKPPLVLPDPSPFSLPSQYASVILDYLDRAVQ